MQTQPKAILPDSINGCESFTIYFPNNSIPHYQNVNFNNTSVLWHFGDGDSSTDFNPVHIYADTGTYPLTLVVFPGLHCADTTSALALVYPFVHADFRYADSCAGQPVSFINHSTSSSGEITNTQWQVFRNTSLVYSSSDNDALVKFSEAPQTYHVFLEIRNDKGCVATDSAWINIENSPSPLSFHDTLLTRGAMLQLHTDDGNFNQGGQYFWTPSY